MNILFSVILKIILFNDDEIQVNVTLTDEVIMGEGGGIIRVRKSVFVLFPSLWK